MVPAGSPLEVLEGPTQCPCPEDVCLLCKPSRVKGLEVTEYLTENKSCFFNEAVMR